MRPVEWQEASPITVVFQELRAIRSNWHVEIGRPSGTGWIRGADFRTARSGPFNALLTDIGERLRTSDKRTIAASFALRYGWSAGIAIAPFLLRQCVPNIALDNVSFKFHENTTFERAALHEPEGVMLPQEGVTAHPSVRWLPDQNALMAALRASLVRQAQPIVEALYEWSHFAERGSWGMITSSWASQLMNICAVVAEQKHGLPYASKLFEGDDVVACMRPTFYPVTYRHVTHVYHRRASCCRYYKLPHGDLCASCPLVGEEERIQRNQEYMRHLLERH
jgi:ferric iron reductase protein FhuF